MTPVPFSIDLTNPAQPSVIVDGDNVADRVGAISFYAGTGQVPQLTLHAQAAGTITGYAVVEVHEPADEDVFLRQAATWAGRVLDMLNAKELEQRALDAQGFGSDTPSMAEAILREVSRSWRVAAGTEEAESLWQST